MLARGRSIYHIIYTYIVFSIKYVTDEQRSFTYDWKNVDVFEKINWAHPDFESNSMGYI